ncbi:hypothetical protein ABZP36_032992 [Zizania latifolia]
MNMGAEASLYKVKEFSTRYLESAIKQLEPNIAKYVKQSLDHPYHVSLMQYKARHHLSYLQTLPNRCCHGGACTCRLSAQQATASDRNAGDQEVLVERRVGLVNDVKEMLLRQRRRQKTASGGRGTLATVDHLQRLCIDHYFQDEVDGAMDDVACLQMLAHGGDLHDAILAFRLMREAGHHVSADEVLGRFTDGNGDFDFDLAYSKDIEGLLGLHDISHMNMGAEASLYKAKHHLSYLQTLPTRCTAMEELALADFQLNKLLHQMEMQEIKRWWLDLGLAQEIPVARDQVQKWYVWLMMAIDGVSFSRCRIELTKIVAFVYIVDDIFDLVGTHDELSCFTKAIKMWDVAAVDSLPSYMRSCYRALYTITNDIADLVRIEHGVNPINHLKKAWAILFDGFMRETEWLSAGQVADSEDYLRNGVVTSGLPLVFVHMLFMLGHDMEKDASGFLDHIPPIMSCPAKILRLWDDLGSAKDEAQEELDGSYKELYLKENPGLSTGEAEEHVRGLIASEWEELNRERFSRRAFSDGFTEAALNMSRMVAVMYTCDGVGEFAVMRPSSPEDASVAAARELHHLLRSRDLRPTLSTYAPSPLRSHSSPTTPSTHSSERSPPPAASLFRRIPSPKSHSFNSLLAVLLRRGRGRAASALFAAFLRSPSASPDATTLNTLLHGLSTASPRPSPPALLRLFRFLPETYAFSPDAISYNSLLSFSTASATCPPRASCSMECASEKKAVEAPSLMAYCAKRLLNEALAIFRTMVEDGVVPNRFTYNTMVQGFCDAGRMELVKEVLEMDSFKPDTCTFNTLMTTHCREGRIEDAMKVFVQMVELLVRRDSASYSMVIRALCKNWEFGRAEELVDELLEGGAQEERGLHIVNCRI